ncbi:unnamed protein product [Amoebophrya sp. A120]|nr:unnamed protein product [Amoebophrya sp. A120]|eukprot:GSA120T00020695001.1
MCPRKAPKEGQSRALLHRPTPSGLERQPREGGPLEGKSRVWFGRFCVLHVARGGAWARGAEMLKKGATAPRFGENEFGFGSPTCIGGFRSWRASIRTSILGTIESRYHDLTLDPDRGHFGPLFSPKKTSFESLPAKIQLLSTARLIVAPKIHLSSNFAALFGSFAMAQRLMGSCNA